MPAKKGYYYDKDKGLWHVRIYDKVRGAYKHVGRFETEELAIVARNAFTGESAPVPQSKASAESLRRILESGKYTYPVNEKVTVHG